tara:strand:+ start:2042 stop:2461 length:420 start_codon:yes stop_codon:yes gene_type:complete
MLKKISNKPTNEPVKPEEQKTQATGKPMPILKYINKMNELYGNGKVVDEYGNPETATTRIQEQDRAKKLSQTRTANAESFYKPKKMSASRSWQIIKQSMNKEELEDHYKRHPEDRPIKITPYKLDDGLTQMLGDEWLTE